MTVLWKQRNDFVVLKRVSLFYVFYAPRFIWMQATFILRFFQCFRSLNFDRSLIISLKGVLPFFTAKWVLHSTSAGTRFFIKYSVMFKGIHCVYLLCHAFKLVFHNWQENIRPLRFPRCKAALSKAYRHSKPWLCTCFQLSRARRCSAPTTRNTRPKITQPQMGSCSEMK